MSSYNPILYRRTIRRLIRANLCVRCRLNPPARCTLHCEGCLDYFNRKRVLKNNGLGRKPVGRL